METPVSRSALYGKLAGPLFRSLESATAFCKLRSNPWVELTHWLHQLLEEAGRSPQPVILFVDEVHTLVPCHRRCKYRRGSSVC